MAILIIILLLGAVGLAVYAFMPSTNSSRGFSPEPVVQKNPFVNELEHQVQSLARQQRNAEAEIARITKTEQDARVELSRMKQDYDNDQAEVKKLQAENKKLKDDFASKSQELDKQFAQRIEFESQIKLGKERVVVLEKENQDLSTKVVAFEKQVSEKPQLSSEELGKALKERDELLEKVKSYAESSQELESLRAKIAEGEKQLQVLNKENSDLTNKVKIFQAQIDEYSREAENKKELAGKEGVLSDEMQQKLKNSEAQIAEKEASIKTLDKEKIDLLNKIKMLETQIQAYNQEEAKLTTELSKTKVTQEASVVSQAEFDELKKKLAAAEEILRIVHGAGT